MSTKTKRHTLRPISYSKQRTYNSVGEHTTKIRGKSVTVNITAEWIGKLGFPGVYVFWKGTRALYIGSGLDVMRRIKRRDPHGPLRTMAFDAARRIEVIGCDNIGQARNLESQLIGIYQPICNNRDRQSYIPTFAALKKLHVRVFGRVA